MAARRPSLAIQIAIIWIIVAFSPTRVMAQLKTTANQDAWAGWNHPSGSGGLLPDFGCPFVSLTQLNVETYEADKLPPDLAALPVTKPGSK